MTEWCNFLGALQTDKRLQVAVSAVLMLLFLQAIGVVHICKFIRDYQGLIGTLVAGGIGFWSVNQTLRGNAATTREQREREIAHDRDTVRATILAELTVLHRVLVHMLTVAQAMSTEGKFWIPKFIRGSELTRAYFAVIEKVRLLSTEQIVAVVTAYSSYEGLSEITRVVGEAQRGDSTSDTQKPIDAFSVYRRSIETAISHVRVAIETLGGIVEKLTVTRLPAEEEKPS